MLHFTNRDSYKVEDKLCGKSRVYVMHFRDAIYDMEFLSHNPKSLYDLEMFNSFQARFAFFKEQAKTLCFLSVFLRPKTRTI